MQRERRLASVQWKVKVKVFFVLHKKIRFPLLTAIFNEKIFDVRATIMPWTAGNIQVELLLLHKTATTLRHPQDRF